MLGIIHKRRYEYAAAKDLFEESLRKFDNGQSFITGRSRSDIVYEIGMMLDGENKLLEARGKFQEIHEHAEKDSYLELDSLYEIARLSLAIWLNKPEENNFPELLNSIRLYGVWISRQWIKAPSKLWAYYGHVCALRQKISYNISRNEIPSTEDYKQLEIMTNRFLLEARNLVGVKKYELRFSAFILSSKEKDHFPGEPLSCGLNNLMSEFLIR